MCGEASCLLWSWPLVWAEGGESCSSSVGHRKGRPSPFANRHEQGAHFPAQLCQLCQCWRQMGRETLQLTPYCWDLPGFSLPPACVLRSVKIWFPDCFLAGCQPEGVNHSTTDLQPGLPSADHSLPTQSQWSRMAPSRPLLTSFRLCAGIVPALLLTWSGNLQRTIQSSWVLQIRQD